MTQLRQRMQEDLRLMEAQLLRCRDSEVATFSLLLNRLCI
jgi:hypothetical protein